MSKSLKELADITYGADYKKNAPGDTVPIIGTGGLMGFTSVALNEGPAVLSGRKGSINSPIYVEGPFWNVDTIFCIKAKPCVDTKWLYYNFLNTNLERLNEATGVPSVSASALYRLKFKYFDYSEQKKIAKILQTIDGQIEKTEAIIAKYKAIKQGLMQDLFTRGIDVATGKLRPSYQQYPELYKPSPLGMIPKDWDAKTLGNLTEKVGSGSTPTGGSEVYTDEGVLFIRSQNVLEGKLSLLDAAFITEAINERMAGSRVKPFDVLLNITGASIGRSAYYPNTLGAANVNQHVCIIRFPEPSKELAVVVSAFLNSPFGQNQIFRFNAGGNREGLNFQQIRSFFFPEMDQKEVKLISQKLGAISTTIESELINLEKLQLIKKGLMSDLLFGKVRVHMDEEALC